MECIKNLRFLWILKWIKTWAFSEGNHFFDEIVQFEFKQCSESVILYIYKNPVRVEALVRLGKSEI